jgi:hypothetical protein
MFNIREEQQDDFYQGILKANRARLDMECDMDEYDGEEVEYIGSSNIPD